MRFKLHLTLDKAAYGDTLPASYQYELTSYIYRTIARGDADFATWLHANGYISNGKPFKLFTFSQLNFAKWRMEGDRIRILSDELTLELSFLPERSTEEFIKGVFSEQSFTLGDRKSKIQLIVRNIESLPAPQYAEEMTFRALSPVCLSRKNDDGRIDYLSPAHESAGSIILNNLLRKYEAFHGHTFDDPLDFGFELLSEPRSKLITIKANSPQQTKVRGYLYNFRLKAPVELMRMAHESGVGEKNSTGFGCVQVIEMG